jgi:SulP family sulfate permease
VATLAAIVIAAVVDLVDIPALASLYRAEFGLLARPDFIAATAALLGILVFDPLPGLFIWITASLVLLIYRASRPYVATLGKTAGPDGHYRDIDRHPDARPRVHHGAPRRGRTVLRERRRGPRPDPASGHARTHPRGRNRCRNDPIIDVTSARMLAELTAELHDRGTQLLIARETGQFRDVIRHVVDGRVLTNVYPTVQAAVEAADTNR